MDLTEGKKTLGKGKAITYTGAKGRRGTSHKAVHQHQYGDERKFVTRRQRRGEKAHIAAQQRGESVSDQLQAALEESSTYFTVVIPWAEPKKRTKWHPAERTGPLSKLTRGAFSTEAEAHKWAKKHLGGNPYEVKKKRK
jgi:hypothetical protein